MTQDLVPSGSRVLCAVSGGADSMCLLHMLSRREDISVVAAHFNHQLRGEESDGDEGFVRDICSQWDIPLTVGRGDVKAFAQREGLSTEEAARVLRYAFLEGAARTEGCDLIATAHNADDNAEAMLLNLIRGTGLSGLGGIPPRRGSIVRPLLDFTRSEVLAYGEEHRIPHREDSSNADERFARNKLRARVMPVLRELNPRMAEHMLGTARRVRELDEALETEARRFSARAEKTDDRVTLPWKALESAGPGLGPRMILQLLDKLEVGRKDFGSTHLEAILSLSPGGWLDLPHGVTVRREYDALVLTTLPPASPLEPMELREGENPVPGTGWTVVVSGPPWPGLVVRPRRTGDVLTLPNGHSRSLKRLLIDRKVSRSERESVPVVADNDGVIAVAGVGPNLSHPRGERVSIIKHREGENTHEHER